MRYRYMKSLVSVVLFLLAMAVSAENIPGRVDDALSVGCNRLIGQGAYILPPVNEFKEELMDLGVKYIKYR